MGPIIYLIHHHYYTIPKYKNNYIVIDTAISDTTNNTVITIPSIITVDNIRDNQSIDQEETYLLSSQKCLRNSQYNNNNNTTKPRPFLFYNRDNFNWLRLLYSSLFSGYQAYLGLILMTTGVGFGFLLYYLFAGVCNIHFKHFVS
ncbi:RING zinc finger-containing protein [Tieghemostelium lacteum]|uniref:RING zinc finger-containing protein n=1 Tax=Tieghemostelium lacteum TaxID=361077 RepID=A0A151Z7V1_TIELA|nr:RING zinc finger-containing protein [Tieghemostelium lacteum]|eukprot:KYQ90008.1 RING zinc finger-containing protein [Tieghemostelium lacteum]